MNEIMYAALAFMEEAARRKKAEMDLADVQRRLQEAQTQIEALTPKPAEKEADGPPKGPDQAG